MTKLLALPLLALVLNSPFTAQAREQIRVVGSSTVYPFVTLAAEHYGKDSGKPTPIVESTGTGGGFKLFCSGLGDDTPDIANASRTIKPSEKELCAKNAVGDITELKIGYDGIVLAALAGTPDFKITKQQLFLALAKQVPVNGELVDNPYKTWNEVDKSLPTQRILVYGPPPTSGTRDAFAELIMEKSCQKVPEFEKSIPEEDKRKQACQTVREDGAFVEAGENDNLIVQKLSSNKDAMGIFGFSFLDMNRNLIKAAAIDGVKPEFETIRNGSYVISRPLYVYVKNAHTTTIPEIKTFAQEIASKAALGEEGYMTEKGLIPLSTEELEITKKAAEGLK